MKKIIVTGCNGQLGRAVNELLKGSEEYELVNTDVGAAVSATPGARELDITDVKNVTEFVDEIKPYAIINCAAHTNVDACETQIDLAYKINALGPRNLAIAARKNDAKLIHISTDYVLSGTGDRPFTEFDPVGPNTAYGKTKLAGENFVKEFSDKHFILRTAWLYGDGKNFVKTMLRLSEDHDEVRVVNDQFGTPTSAKELAKAILYLLPTENYGLFHATCEGSTNWADFAKLIFEKAGKSTRVTPVSTAEYNAPAPRPANSILENYMFKLTGDFMFADWVDALDEYMETLV